ncbi:MAG: multicomponent Na+:H+ antiporter subunit B [Polaribacter sp.]
MLTLLVVIAIAINQTKDMFAAVMLAGIFGLVSASFFVVMDAVDVAFTEASVGAGISTLLMLTTVAMTGRTEHEASHKPLLALFVVTVTGGLLIYGTFDMPYFGSADAPIHSHVGSRYIYDSMKEIGVPNMVTSVLASYRGFDTFGEVTVIFTAGIGVLALLTVVRRQKNDAAIEAINDSMHEKHLILRVVIKTMIPFILLYAFYVQFHGDYGPGGGFQAGVIFAAGIILYAMLFSLSAARRVITQPFVQLLSAIGVLLYGSVGLVSMLNGGSFLDYSVLSADPIAGQHLGILLIELGVGLTVASVMIIIFFSFSARSEYQQANKGESL